MNVKMKSRKRQPYQLVSVVLTSALVSCLVGVPSLISAVEGALSYPSGHNWTVSRTAAVPKTSGGQWRGSEEGYRRNNNLNNIDGGSLNNNICNSDRLAVYKVVLHTYWTRDQFPKHYPDWRPPAQWSNTIG